MKEQVLKAIQERTNFPQHQTQKIKEIVEDAIGNEDITTKNTILSRIAINIICNLKNKNLISEQIRGALYMDIMEAMGVY